MTKKEYFAVLDEIVVNSGDSRTEDVRGFIAHEMEMLAKKSSSRKPTKVQIENVALIERVETALAMAGKPMTVSELMAFDSELGKLSNQKVTALVNKSERVVRTHDKKKAYFSLAE